ncbi:MAG: hypothetical protein QNJ54_34475 [Prochloraceae cyanobacterium]|nr:hypothetical protein [Prochloraceae cyanobacterium]
MQITLAFVPGGPDAITKGLGRVNPFTLVVSWGILELLALIKLLRPS